MWTRRTDENRRRIDAALRELAATTPVDAPLPDPSFIWWKAQLLRRLEAEREATSFIDMGDRFHIGAAAIGAGALAAGAWEYLPQVTFALPTSMSRITLLATLGAVVVLAVVALATRDAQRPH